ncbi:unnamed protein product [Orchesella dallaii]|uniref:Adenosylmethionine decarboxylase n=1 Tax=Orchesella dallaii TaxID=48710 RepID=A0ABP1PTW2_9HEXA
MSDKNNGHAINIISDTSDSDSDVSATGIDGVFLKKSESVGTNSDSDGEAFKAGDSKVAGNGEAEVGKDSGGMEQSPGGTEGAVGDGGGDNLTYFEGAEKLLEVMFARLDEKTGDCNLRRIPRSKLEEMLKIVHCQIIGSASNEEIDSYVLSESSLFVSKKCIIIKTCGTTTPLACLQFLWELVNGFTGFDCIEDVYYSHKNFKEPSRQQQPYRKFESEVALLNDFFEKSGASAYCLGSINQDCWYLYTYNHPGFLKNAQDGLMERLGGHHHQPDGAGKNEMSLCKRNMEKFEECIPKKGKATTHLSALQESVEPEQTLEILMTYLDPQVMQIFTKKHSVNAENATKNSGIDRIIPGMVINDSLFEPCGYSMNGIMENGAYMTIHITPEEDFSYVSFETNISMHSYKKLIDSVVEVFNPGKFVLTFFANQESQGYVGHAEMKDMEIVKNQWVREDSEFCRLKKNDLTYAFYNKSNI